MPGIRQRAPMRSVYTYDRAALERSGESGRRVAGTDVSSGRGSNRGARQPVPAQRAVAPSASAARSRIAPETRPAAIAPTTRPGGIAPASRPAAIAPTTRPVGIAPASRPTPIAPAARPAMIAPASRAGAPNLRAGDLYAGPRGEVYRRSNAGGWEQQGGTAWRPAAPAPGLDREFQARSMGETRSRGFQSAGGASGGSRGEGVRGGGGGMRGGGGGTRGGRR